MNLAFTLCSNNYLAQAVTLGKSLVLQNPDYIFKIGLVDRESFQINYSSLPFEIIPVEKLGMLAFDSMFKKYSITELNTAVKPFFFRYFFEKDNSVDSIIYLDPDICVYSAFTELDSKLKEFEIVLTPHFTTPIEDDKLPSENEILNAGLYNLGFIALKRGTESQKLVDWWSKRLETRAYIDFQNGMFTDQLWLNFAPLYFNHVTILSHPGYNMAYWNLHERTLVEDNFVSCKGCVFPLVFYHFSGLNPLEPDKLSKYQNRFLPGQADSPLAKLFREYAEILLSSGFREYGEIPCYFKEEKSRIDAEAYLNYKRSVPIIKRILRGLILRAIRLFKVNIDYYTH